MNVSPLNQQQKGCSELMFDYSMLTNLIGRSLTMLVDRPLGSSHPNYPDIIYPINYGYIPGLLAADGEEQDVYLLGVYEPVETCTGVIIAILTRTDDVEDKLVMAPAGKSITDSEILEQTYFQEQYFKTTLIRL